jgi:hypothetical protein
MERKYGVTEMAIGEFKNRLSAASVDRTVLFLQKQLMVCHLVNQAPIKTSLIISIN